MSIFGRSTRSNGRFTAGLPEAFFRRYFVAAFRRGPARFCGCQRIVFDCRMANDPAMINKIGGDKSPFPIPKTQSHLSKPTSAVVYCQPNTIDNHTISTPKTIAITVNDTSDFDTGGGFHSKPYSSKTGLSVYLKRLQDTL
jgi:hypothetical protein